MSFISISIFYSIYIGVIGALSAQGNGSSPFLSCFPKIILVISNQDTACMCPFRPIIVIISERFVEKQSTEERRKQLTSSKSQYAARLPRVSSCIRSVLFKRKPKLLIWIGLSRKRPQESQMSLSVAPKSAHHCSTTHERKH